MMVLEYATNRADLAELTAHLRACDAAFVPTLSGRVDLDAYGQKISERAVRFEAWASGQLVGLVAAYCNDERRSAVFITSVSVLFEWQGHGIASQLLQCCIQHARHLGFSRVELEVDCRNLAATGLYEKLGFSAVKPAGQLAIMAFCTGMGA